jgi:type I restriction enzyme, S subunit
MKGWEQIEISQLYQALYDGPHATPKPSSSGKIFLRIENITEDGHLDFSKPTYISEEDYPRWIRRVKPNKGDIVFSYEATLGRYAIIPEGFEGCLGRRIALIRPNNSKAHYKFLYKYFYSSIWQQELGNYLISGATVDRIPLIKFPKFKVFCPSLPIQRKIAAVLSAYDDLIENNNRRIAILEKMAEELYREWFVRLRFPGHEKVKIVKGVPDGWVVKRIRDIVVRKSFGKIYRDSDLHDEGKIIVIDQSINEYLGFYDGEPEHMASKESPILLFGDHSCKMQLMIEPFSLAENVIPFVANGNMPTAFLFYTIHNSIETTEYKRHWTELINKEVYIPREELQLDFARIAMNHIHQKEQLRTINRRLIITRDRLLSRLMSGKIDVENLDIHFPASMQEEVADEWLTGRKT